MLTVWIIIAIVLAVVEMCTTGFLALWFAAGAGITAIALAIYPELSLAIQVIIFGASSSLLFLLTKNKVQRNSDKNSAAPVYSILGKHAVVTKEINTVKGVGQITINGDVWSAKSENPELIIPENSKVEVLEINGVKAVVRLLEEPVNKQVQ